MVVGRVTVTYGVTHRRAREAKDEAAAAAAAAAAADETTTEDDEEEDDDDDLVVRVRRATFRWAALDEPKEVHYSYSELLRGPIRMRHVISTTRRSAGPRSTSRRRWYIAADSQTGGFFSKCSARWNTSSALSFVKNKNDKTRRTVRK